MPTAVFIRDVRQIEPLDAYLKERARLGNDLLDEVWDGVLHMSPGAHGEHQDLATWFCEVTRIQCRRYHLGRPYVQINVRRPGSEAKDFRIPDLAVLGPERGLVDGWIETGCTVAIEVRSPREEFDLKLAFYGARGIPELLYIDRITLRFALLRLVKGAYVTVKPDRRGTVEVAGLALRIRRVVRKGTPTLELTDARTGEALPPR